MLWAFLTGAVVMLAVLTVIGWCMGSSPDATSARIGKIKTEEQMALWQVQAASRQAREAMLRAVQEGPGRGRE